MSDPTPTDTTDGTWGGIDLTAVKTLIAHQRRDIGHCMCGWGVDAGNWGQSHALHVWRVLQAEVLPVHDRRVRAAVAEGIAAYADRMAAVGWVHIEVGARKAADIARQHATTTEDTDAA